MDFNFIFDSSPKITKSITLISGTISILCWLNIISPLYLYLNHELIFKRCQIWRIFTNFFFFGSLSANCVFHLILFFRNSKLLEKNVFKGNAADYLFFLLFFTINIFIISPLFNIVFLSHSLSFAMTYYWGRKSKNGIVLIMGILTLRAQYLPIFYLIFSIILNSDFREDLIGFLIGHLFYFIKDILPRIKRVKKKQFLKTPNFIKKFCEICNLNNEYILEGEEENMFF